MGVQKVALCRELLHTIPIMPMLHRVWKPAQLTLHLTLLPLGGIHRILGACSAYSTVGSVVNLKIVVNSLHLPVLVLLEQQRSTQCYRKSARYAY
jgi:hypothetical protein